MEQLGRWLISLKGVEHSRMRALAATPFARHLVDGYVPTIDRVTRTLLDSMEASSQPVELMSAYAYRVPIQVIAALMGVPEEDRPKLDAPLMRLGTALERQRDPAWVAAGDGAIDALNAYFEPLLHDRRRRPSDDLLSALAAGTDVAFDTVLANAIFLMVAGHQTTMATIGSCVLMLLQRGDQMALIRERPDLASSAIEESLRFQSPVQITERTALATSTSMDSASNQATTSRSSSARSTVTRACSPTRIGSRSPAIPTPTSPSPPDPTSAWARRLPGWRRPWRSRPS